MRQSRHSLLAFPKFNI